MKTLDDGPPKTDAAFDEMANSIKVAILDGVQPKMITKGSSGSYFARRKLDSRPQVVGCVNLPCFGRHDADTASVTRQCVQAER